MKRITPVALVAAAALILAWQTHGQAQGGGSRSGGSPRPGRGTGGQNPSAAGRTNATQAAGAARPQSGSTNQFGRLPLNSGFFFLADTNLTYLWTKISAGTASNAVTRRSAAIISTTPVRSQ